MAFTRKGFTQVVGNAFAGFGFPPEGPSVYEFPMEMFVAGSDLTPINENIDKVVYGLTKWEPKIKEKGIFYPAEKVKVQGKDYRETVANLNALFLKNMWSDGLPLLPATEEQVNWILTGTDLPPDTVIGKILPRGGICAVKDVAIGLTMAGGRPEYMPLLIAIVEAILDPILWHQGWQATTCSVYPAMIVNGPVAKQIRLSSGYGLLGPDPLHPAGASIGRAVRLILTNLGGAIPGIGSMALYGGPARYTGLVFAEDEAGIPPGWEPLNVELGFSKGTNTVTIVMVSSTENLQGGIRGPRGVMLTVDQNAAHMSSPNKNLKFGGGPEWEEGAPGVLLWARGTAQAVADLGWSKEDAKAYLWENSKVPWSVVEKSYYRVEERLAQNPSLAEGKPWPITSKPENIIIVVAGGAQSGHGYWMQGAFITKPVTKEIKPPANWEELLKQAEEDLGPPPAD